MSRCTVVWMMGTLLAILPACERQTPQHADEDNQATRPAQAARATAAPAAAPTTQASPWYDDLTLSQAFSKAQADGKLLFVFVWSPKCSVCELMERQVLQDEDVRTFLRKHTIPIKLDATDNRLLALRYQIIATPTFLFLRPDGGEIDRMISLISRDEFLNTATEFVAGRNRVDMALRELVSAHYYLGAALIQKARYADALNEYLLALDRCCSDSPGLFDGWASYVVSAIVNLAQRHAAANAALEERVAAARERLLARTPKTTDFQLVSTVNRYLRRSDETLALYDQIRTQCQDKDVLAKWTLEVFDALAAAKRYEDIAAGADLEQAINRLFEQAEMNEPRAADYARESELNQAKVEHGRYLVHYVCDYYQTLLVLKRDELAEQTAARLLEAVPGTNTLNALAWAGYLSGRPTEANLEQARRAHEMAHENSAAIADTLARILAVRGQRDEALKTIDKCLERAGNSEDRSMLERCRDDIQKQP